MWQITAITKTEKRPAVSATDTESRKAYPDGSAQTAMEKVKFARIVTSLYRQVTEQFAVILELS